MLKFARLAIPLLVFSQFALAMTLSDCKVKEGTTAVNFLKAKNNISYFSSDEKTFTQRISHLPCVFSSQNSASLVFLIISVSQNNDNFQSIRIEAEDYGPIYYDANGKIIEDKYSQRATESNKISATKIVSDFQAAIKN